MIKREKLVCRLWHRVTCVVCQPDDPICRTEVTRAVPYAREVLSFGALQTLNHSEGDTTRWHTDSCKGGSRIPGPVCHSLTLAQCERHVQVSKDHICDPPALCPSGVRGSLPAVKEARA